MAQTDKPKGRITTVIDLVSRDSQDNYIFPSDTDQTWFSDEPYQKAHTTSNSIQEWPHKGSAEWNGKMEFVLGKIQAGDLLKDIILQFRVGHWYDATTISRLQTGGYTGIDMASSAPWTYINSLGTSIIEYAEIQVGDQTLETLTGEFIRVFYTLYPGINEAFGLGVDAIGEGSVSELSANTGMFSPIRPYPTDRGIYFCVLPFFFSRIRLKETLPLLSCADKSVRIIIKFRPFSEAVRIARSGVNRISCTDTSLGKSVTFIGTPGKTISMSDIIPSLQDVRIITHCSLLSETLRLQYLRKPFEQLYRFVQSFEFTEPYKYISNKPNASKDVVNIQLPLELNHPVQELVWVFRRKAVQINNEWSNFNPFVSSQYGADRFFPEWLGSASLRVNGMVVEQGHGNRFRYDCAQKHRGGILAWSSNVYGYSFAQYPSIHQPSGTANMSKSHSVVLDLTVNVPFAVPVPPGFDAVVSRGWEVFVYVFYYNWLRFENGIVNRLFSE